MSTRVRTPVREPVTGSPAAVAAGTEPGQRTSARRPARPQRPGRPGHPERPVRPASPVRPAGPGRPGPSRGSQARSGGKSDLEAGQFAAARPGVPGTGLLARLARGQAGERPVPQAGRSMFVLFVLGLLGGGLISLLVVNTTLAAASMRIGELRQRSASQLQQVQELQQAVARDRSATVIAREAAQLGMRQQPLIYFLDLRTNRIRTEPTTLPGVPAVPGYTP